MNPATHGTEGSAAAPVMYMALRDPPGSASGKLQFPGNSAGLECSR